MRDLMMNPSQIRSAGLAALSKALGPVGMARFIQQFELGTGNYTKDRSHWLDQMSIEDIFSGINKMRSTDLSTEKK